MISAIIALLVIAILAALAYWIIDQIPVPDPLNRIIKIVIVVLCVLAIVAVLLGISGGGGFSLPALR